MEEEKCGFYKVLIKKKRFSKKVFQKKKSIHGFFVDVLFLVHVNSFSSAIIHTPSYTLTHVYSQFTH